MENTVLESTGHWDFKRLDRQVVMHDQRVRYDHNIASFEASMQVRARVSTVSETDDSVLEADEVEVADSELLDSNGYSE